ncbi:hypothetical protein PPERSA_03123 [Pseudocohnilembus persalinus]|uniref:Uncharacterized protein n=1 Tax=Pseudocohnilembus persalinus TaxID=266149 RepID=A0A0V0QII9_PSEPJ|nr:hypothetical protein PPERSA_03123 [Pseudocohnilembus persalinus]|eukprot:KRX02061.1 hypothetical protein PPERSA_03123 [Pseudocohnilembus persalinus]
MLEQQDISLEMNPQNIQSYHEIMFTHHSVQINKNCSAVIFRDLIENAGLISILFLDYQGHMKSQKYFSNQHKFNQKFYLQTTNQDDEIIFAFTNNYYLYFGFLNCEGQYTRGTSKPQQPITFKNKKLNHVEISTGANYAYIAAQEKVSPSTKDPSHVYLFIINISNFDSYTLETEIKYINSNVVFNQFSSMVLEDGYFVGTGQLSGSLRVVYKFNFDLISNTQSLATGKFYEKILTPYSFVQNGLIKAPGTDFIVFIIGDYYYDTLVVQIYEQRITSASSSQCYMVHDNLFNGENYVYRFLQYGILNEKYIWVKADNPSLNFQSFLFFVDFDTCDIYKDSNGFSKQLSK